MYILKRLCVILTRPKAPALGCLLELQQQNRAIVTPILGNEAGETAKEHSKRNLKKVGKKAYQSPIKSSE